MLTPKSMILVGRRIHFQRTEKGFYDALGRRLRLKLVFIEDGWPAKAEDVPDFKDYDAWMWWVPFRELMRRPSFDWGSFPGLRIMFEMDAVTNFHHIVGSKYLGAWPEVFHRNEFDLLVCTGRLTRDMLLADGVAAYWLPKAYDPSCLFDTGGERQGVCYYGTPYRARRAMLDYLKRKRIKVDYVKCSFGELNTHLNHHLGCLICNMAATPKRGLGRLIHHYFPSMGVVVEPGAEPMLKNFEVAGAGCAPIADWIDELAELGFEDGKTIVSYQSFEELVDKLRSYLRNPQELRQVGLNAERLVRERHTWDHRAEQFYKLLVERGESAHAVL